MGTDQYSPFTSELHLAAPDADQETAAARTIGRYARDNEDRVLLLAALGLPDTDTALPALPRPEGAPDMPLLTTNAFEAMALSMYRADADVATITEATGLTEDEITALVASREQTPRTPRGDAATPITEHTTEVEQLLAWAANHPTAAFRGKAARIRADIADLAARRETAEAQRVAERRIRKLKAELEQAQRQLRAAKAGTRPATTDTAPTPIRPKAAGRSKEELTTIRAWARANGHQVAGTGMVRKEVLEAYDAAHQAPAAKAS